MDLTVLHEPGKGMDNSLARALGVKREPRFWMLRKGQALEMPPVSKLSDEMLDLACKGLDYQSAKWLGKFADMLKTTREQMLDLCGQPHETETVDGRDLWTYRFSSSDNESKKVVTIRFDAEGRYSGRAESTRLVNPSHVSIKLSRDFWERQVVPGLGRENMPEANPNHHVEIWLTRGKGGGAIIGGGHPLVEIVPETLYERELAPGTYRVSIRLMDHADNNYRQAQDMEILPELIIGRNESVSLFFQDANGPDIERSTYAAGERDLAAENRQRMLKRPDWKARVKQANQEEPKYDDPKYLPWQLHLKEIAARYQSSPLPERTELTPKETDESYALTMFPKNLPGHAGYSAISLEGDLKKHCSHILGPGVTRWPDDTPSMQLSHDLVYRDDVLQRERYMFVLGQLGYSIEKVTENRTAYVATYDGRALPDPETVSAPNPAGWGYHTARFLINMLTRANNPGPLANGPVFIDETGLPSKPGPGQTHEDIAISMEMPSTDLDFETLRPWFRDNFGITFTQETRPMELFVIKKK